MPRPRSVPSRSLRLRRRRFPRNRPRGAPYGYLEGLAWLSEELLWIDGWLTGVSNYQEVEVTLDLAGTRLRARTPVLLDQEDAYHEVPGSRRWILAFPVDRASRAVSCVRDVTLTLSCGEVLWHGGRERLIAPDATERLQALASRPDLLARTDAYLGTVSEDRGLDALEDSLFARNLQALRATWARAGGPQPLPASRPSVHVEHSAASPGGTLLLSGWLDTAKLGRTALSVLTRSGERLSLLDHAITYSRSDLDPITSGGSDAVRAFVAVMSLKGAPVESAPALCIDDPKEGVVVSPLEPQVVPPSEITRIIEDLVKLTSSDVDDETAHRLLAPISAELTVGPTFYEPVPFGVRPTEPRLTVITSFLDSYDLLDHHFVHADPVGQRSREDLLLFGPEPNRTAIFARLEGLAELYDLSGLAFFQRREACWGTLMQEAARRARGEVLVFCSGRALSLECGGMEPLVRTLLHKPTIGIAAPAVSSFDGRKRSAVVRALSDRIATRRLSQPQEPEPAIVEGSPDLCLPDCFAIRWSVFVDIGGFSSHYFHAELEVADLCRRALNGRRSIALAPMTVTRIGADSCGYRAGVGTPLSVRHDLDRLRRRAQDGLQDGPNAEIGEIPGTESRRLEEALRPRFSERMASAPSPLASIVIPTYNAGPEFEEVLERIESQEVLGEFEILVIDSGSTDGTRELLRRRKIQCLDLAREEFSHGSTRQLGADRAEADIVVYLSQDALPLPGWLGGLIRAFDDPTVAGSYSRQIPRDEASPFVVDQLSRWPATWSSPRLQRLGDPEKFAELTLEKKLETLCFDNVSSAVRRSVIQKIPLRNVRFSADRDWAYRVLKAGYVIAFRPDSQVVHSHNRSAWYELKRTFCDHRSLRQLFDGNDLPTVFDTLHSCRNETFRLLDLACQGATWTSRIQLRLGVPAVALARTLGESLGTRAAVRCAEGSRLWTFLSRTLQWGV